MIPGIWIPSITDTRYRHIHIARRLCHIVIWDENPEAEVLGEMYSLPTWCVVAKVKTTKTRMYEPVPPSKPAHLRSKRESAVLRALASNYSQE